MFFLKWFSLGRDGHRYFSPQTLCNIFWRCAENLLFYQLTASRMCQCSTSLLSFHSWRQTRLCGFSVTSTCWKMLRLAQLQTKQPSDTFCLLMILHWFDSWSYEMLQMPQRSADIFEEFRCVSSGRTGCFGDQTLFLSLALSNCLNRANLW